MGHGGALVAHQGQRATKQHGKHQHLQHVAGGEGIDHRGGNQLHQEFHCAPAYQFLGVAGKCTHGFGVESAGIHIHAHAWLEPKGQRQTQQQRDGRHDLKVDQCLDPNAPDAPKIACTSNPMDDHTEHQDGNDHLDQFDEAVAQRLELDGELGRTHAQDHPQEQCQQHLPEQRFEKLCHGVSIRFGLQD